MKMWGVVIFSLLSPVPPSSCDCSCLRHLPSPQPTFGSSLCPATQVLTGSPCSTGCKSQEISPERWCQQSQMWSIVLSAQRPRLESDGALQLVKLPRRTEVTVDVPQYPQCDVCYLLQAMTLAYALLKYGCGSGEAAAGNRQQLHLEVPEARRNKEPTSSPETRFFLADNPHCQASVPPTDKVCLWLGANVMPEYGIDEAPALLAKNLSTATKNLDSLEEDLDSFFEINLLPQKSSKSRY
ncbi:hypothetical protein GH733_012076 [Mirounga leonina]|nr:hypothetical protein GH733_012076 [Mirounga leonina]